MHVKLFESVFRRMEDLHQISFQIYVSTAYSDTSHMMLISFMSTSHVIWRESLLVVSNSTSSL